MANAKARRDAAYIIPARAVPLLEAMTAEGGDWSAARAARAVAEPDAPFSPQQAYLLMQNLAAHGKLVRVEGRRAFRLPD